MKASTAILYADLLGELAGSEGSAVTVLGGKPFAIEISDGWTRWQPRRFTGDTILACLLLAAIDRKQTLKERPND